MFRSMRMIAAIAVGVAVAGCSGDRTTSPVPTETTELRAPSFTELPDEIACMGDRIWNDINRNGIQDEGEPGLGGVTVQLWECPNHILIDETLSESDGYYALFGPSMDDYYIIVQAPAGWTITASNQGGDDTRDSDVDPSSGVGFCTHLGKGEIEKDMDAGLYRDEPTKGGDGCTPGFWKTKPEIWGPTGYAPADLFSDVFGCGPKVSLLDVMWTGGGGYKALYRHAVAALLNASHPDVDYDMSAGSIISAVCAVGNGGVETLKNQLGGFNEQGCSIDAHGIPTTTGTGAKKSK